MKHKNSLSLFLIFVLWIFVFAPAEESRQKKDSGRGMAKSLIRKELLVKKRRELQAPRRNIFSPRALGRNEIPAKPAEPEPDTQPAVPSPPAATLLTLDLRYIGYLVQGEKMIALIILEGEVLSVSRGDTIGEGIEVGEITPSELEVIGRGSEKRKFLIEGDEQ
jgi:hypothetical protein